MKIAQTLLGAAAGFGLLVGGTSAAFATTINFDQRDSGATGGLSHDGATAPLVGSDISFSFVSSPSRPDSIDCSGCLLNFTTGDLISSDDGLYTFGEGGSFELTGDVLDNGSTVASGSLLSGEFVGSQRFIRQGDDSGTFNGNGANTVNDALAQLYGIAAGSDFMFINTDFSIGNLDFNDDGTFSGDVDAADLATNDVASADVPEPQEVGIFGLGLALMIGSLMYRRRNGADLG